MGKNFMKTKYSPQTPCDLINEILEAKLKCLLVYISNLNVVEFILV